MRNAATIHFFAGIEEYAYFQFELVGLAEKAFYQQMNGTLSTKPATFVAGTFGEKQKQPAAAMVIFTPKPQRPERHYLCLCSDPEEPA